MTSAAKSIISRLQGYDIEMGTISSLFAHKVINVATADDPVPSQRRKELLQSVGLDPEGPIEPKRMVPDLEYYSLCERVVREDREPITVPLRVGSSMRCDEYGAFGLAWKSAIDLRRSYERAERYGLVLTSVSKYTVTSENGRHFMMLHREGERGLGLRLSNEQTIVAITQISREVSQTPFAPVAVYFKHPSPGDLTAHEAYFACPVHYSADRDALELSETMLQAPNKLGDASISAFFETHLEKELAESTDDTSLAKRMRNQISQSLSEGVPRLGEVAERLNLSPRTLQRRLSEQRLSFQDLVDETRRELAERLLKKTDYALSEVAFLTGFSEQSSFNRAFKRWAGQTPRSYRLSGA